MPCREVPPVNRDPLTKFLTKPRGKKALTEKLKNLIEQARRLDEENKVLRATLKIMGGETGVHNREMKKDKDGERYEYADVFFPFLFPAGWRRADNGYTQKEIDGVPHAVIRVIKNDR